jgi:hypothetical protein
MPHHRPALQRTLVLIALLLPVWAQATVWRCGPDGRSFSDRPCADGTLVPIAPPPGAERVLQAQVVAQREAALAEQLRAQRLAREQAWQQQLAQEARDRRAAARAAERQARREQAALRKAGAEEAPGLRLSPQRLAVSAPEPRPPRPPRH